MLGRNGAPHDYRGAKAGQAGRQGSAKGETHFPFGDITCCYTCGGMGDHIAAPITILCQMAALCAPFVAACLPCLWLSVPFATAPEITRLAARVYVRGAHLRSRVINKSEGGVYLRAYFRRCAAPPASSCARLRILSPPSVRLVGGLTYFADSGSAYRQFSKLLRMPLCPATYCV